MPTHVTCAACGARIKADRERCLRCFEILVAAPEPTLIERLTPEQRRVAAAVGAGRKNSSVEPATNAQQTPAASHAPARPPGIT